MLKILWLSLTAIVAFTSCGIIDHSAMHTYHRYIIKAPFDVVIVPGLPFDTARLNPMLKARMLWAKELYDSGIARHIIFSGSAVHSPYVEAMVMKIMADSMAIPSRHTFVEDEALHSNENVAYGVKKALAMGFKNIAVATDPIQALVVKKYIRDNHSSVSILPFSLKAMPLYYQSAFPKVNPEEAFVEDFVPLKQRSNPFTGLD
jgi:hypothetical protein